MYIVHNTHDYKHTLSLVFKAKFAKLNYCASKNIHITTLIFLLYLEPPKFTETPINHEFKPQPVHIGNPDDPTCYICVNCSVTGSPAPVVTWEHQYNGMADYSCITTNQSDA